MDWLPKRIEIRINAKEDNLEREHKEERVATTIMTVAFSIFLILVAVSVMYGCES